MDFDPQCRRENKNVLLPTETKISLTRRRYSIYCTLSNPPGFISCGRLIQKWAWWPWSTGNPTLALIKLDASHSCRRHQSSALSVQQLTSINVTRCVSCLLEKKKNHRDNLRISEFHCKAERRLLASSEDVSVRPYVCISSY